MLFSYMLVPWTAKKPRKPMLFPAASKLTRLKSVSWSPLNWARSEAGLARYAVGERLRDVFWSWVVERDREPGLRFA